MYGIYYEGYDGTRLVTGYTGELTTIEGVEKRFLNLTKDLKEVRYALYELIDGDVHIIDYVGNIKDKKSYKTNLTRRGNPS